MMTEHDAQKQRLALRLALYIYTLYLRFLKFYDWNISN